jgi:hypothetical protein
MRPRTVLLAVFSLQLITVGGMLLLGSWEQYGTARGTRPEPQVIPLRDLMRDGYGDNRHVKITGCALGPRYVYLEKDWRWQEVWIPLFPVDDGPGNGMPGGQNLWVLVRSTRPQRQQDLQLLLQDASVQGVLVRGASGVGVYEKVELQELYPQLDWSRCLLLNEGRVPMRESTTVGLLVASVSVLGLGGVLFAAWGIFCFHSWLKDYRKRRRLLAAAAWSKRPSGAGPLRASAPGSGGGPRPLEIRPADEGTRPPTDASPVQEDGP